MSITTKRRIVTNELQLEMVEPRDGQLVAKIGGSRGNNTFEVEDEHGDHYLASLPTKFRKTVWVRRGHFVLLEPIEEGDKIKAEVVAVLDAENVLHIERRGVWPARFAQEADSMKRSSKPENEAKDVKLTELIDADMLPPRFVVFTPAQDGMISESDDDESEEEEVDDEEEADEEDDDVPSVCNPNWAAAPR